MGDYNFKAADLAKKPSLLDGYTAPLLVTWEWSIANDAKDTAEAMIVLARRGYIPILQSAALGGGFGGKQVMIFTTFRRAEKVKRE